MSESLYRYMSFESFVDTVQRKQLHFVHPSEFEDPMEFQYLQKMCVSEPSNYIEILYKFAMVYRFMCSLGQFSRKVMRCGEFIIIIILQCE